MKLLMILTVLGSLVALWFSLMLLGFLAARLLRITFRASLTMLAGGLLLTAAVLRRGLLLARYVTAFPLSWAERRWNKVSTVRSTTRIGEFGETSNRCSTNIGFSARVLDSAANTGDRTLMFRGEPFLAVRTQVAGSTVRPEVWYHIECGHNNRPESKFCGKCGVARSLAYRRGEVLVTPIGVPASHEYTNPVLAGAVPINDTREVTWLDEPVKTGQAKIGQNYGSKSGSGFGIVYLDEARTQPHA